MPKHPLARGLLLMVLVIGGVVAMGYGVKHDNPYAFVPGLIVAVVGVLDVMNYGRRPSD